MTDAEVLCTFMEGKPQRSWLDGYEPFDPDAPPCPWKWWYWDGMASPWGGAAKPRNLTLDALHEIEALARVLRPVVEGGSRG